MKIKQLVNDKELWDAFLEEIDVLIEVEHRGLEQHTNPNDLYRCQGAVKALRRMKQLRDDVNGRK